MSFKPLDDFLICLRFFSRLPLPVSAREAALGARGLAMAAAMAPVAGAAIGLGPACVVAAARGFGLPPAVAALLALATLLALTGALHEDGLADCADGFGGGLTRERKLAIMRDSRIGTYGTCAAVLSLGLRAASLTAIATHGSLFAGTALIATAGLSRVLCLLPLLLLKPARTDGAGAGNAGLDTRQMVGAFGLSLVIAALPCLAGGTIRHQALAATMATAAALLVCVIADRQIGGQTGDVAGAAQQVAEIAMLVALSA